jgi:hypothetical protein
MAKLNWQKLNRQSHYQSIREKTFEQLPYGGSNFLKDNNIWQLKGKYLGTHIHKLPLQYLNWIIDNHSTGNYRQQAEDELYRRYAELSNT